ncbi:4-hydroxyphenylacetate 3-hydroxylase N-terminal domain-containing protein [candidate division CSSED10-310 bacterium]|uniref:4-hydroxyphenylacetate 3-hydroxylase N-terminal domain-containing protein n=1 Tax=candidate division CSSED10-310 bacterium TaxID=2855610 RepID=A0ABV6YTE2_UNCC1
MSLKTVDEYVESVKNRKPMNVWFKGQKIEDPIKEPALQASFNTIKKLYELTNNPEYADILTTHSALIDEQVSFYLSPLLKREDAIQKTRMARLLAEIFGCCSHRCTGSEAIGGLYPFTYDVDQKFGTNYHQNLKNWIIHCQQNDLAVAAALTDPKGDRKKKPQDQPVPDLYLRVKEKRADGIVVEGAKVNQTGTIFTHEVAIIPTSAFTEEGKEYVVAGAIPADTEGLIYVLGRTPFDMRICEDEEEMIDFGKKYADHQAMLIFEDVFIPNDRIFFCEEWQMSGLLLEYFTAIHRLTAGACKAGGMSLLLGATTLSANHLGIERFSHVRGKLTEMAMNAETLYALSLSAGYEGFQHESGAWVPNSLLAHTAKYNSTNLPFHGVRLARELLSGWGETAPSIKDLNQAEIGPKIQKYYTPYAQEGVSAEDRLRAVRLVENLVRGTNWTSMALHGGGNSEAARLMAMRHVDWKKLITLAEAICGIEQDDEEAIKKIAERSGKIDLGPKAFKVK